MFGKIPCLVKSALLLTLFHMFGSYFGALSMLYYSSVFGAAHLALHVLLPKPLHHSKIMIIACVHSRYWCCASGASCTATQTTVSFHTLNHSMCAFSTSYHSSVFGAAHLVLCAFSMLVLRIGCSVHCYPNHCIIPKLLSLLVRILNVGAAHMVLNLLLSIPCFTPYFSSQHVCNLNIVLQQRVCAVCILNVGAAHRVLHLLLPKPQHHSKIMILACVHSRYWCCAFVLNLLLSIPLLLYQSILLITACAHSQCQSCASGAQFAAIHTLYQSILLITACVHSQCQSCASGAQFAAIHTLFHSILFITACAHFQCCIAAACWCCTSGAHSPLLSPAAAPHQSHAQVCVCLCGCGCGCGCACACACVHVCAHDLGSSHC